MPELTEAPGRSSPVIALTAFPLSRDYRARLEAALGVAPDYSTLSELRQLSLTAMLGRLAGMRAERIILPLEDAASAASVPLLGALASLTRAKRIETAAPDLSLARYSRLRALGWLLGAAWASASGLVTALSCRRELRRLNAARRAPASVADGAVLYLKTSLSTGIRAGGSVGHVAGVVNGLVRKGLRVLLLSADRPLMVDPSVDHREIGIPPVLGLPRDVNLYRFHRRFLRRTLELASPAPVGFIYQRLSTGNYVGVVLSRKIEAPLVLEYNGSEVWAAMHWGYPLRFPGIAASAEEACLRHAHLIVTVSDALRDQLVERGIEPERIVTYPNCIDPEVFDPARFSRQDAGGLRDRYGIPAGAVVVTFLGTFGRWHGVDVLARAIVDLVDRDRDWLEERGVRFLLVGDGVQRAEIESILAPEPYARYVTMPGLVPQDQAPRHLAASDVLVAPTVRNPDGTPFFGSPTKLFEYMAMAKAIVASDLDQIGQVLRGSPRADRLEGTRDLPGESAAVLVEPGDPAELARAIRLLAERPAWRRQIGLRARRRALSDYTWDRHVDAILSAPPLRSSGRTTRSD